MNEYVNNIIDNLPDSGLPNDNINLEDNNMLTKKRTITPQQFNPNAAAFTSDNAAIYIGIPATTLKLSRHSGNLFGTPPPKYKKCDRKVIYMKSELDRWLESLPEK